MIEQIWTKFHQLLLKFITAKVGDITIAEDILQDVFIQVINKIDTLEDKTKLQSWLYQICRNKIIDYYRTKKLDITNIDLYDNLVAEHEYEENEHLNSCVQILISDMPENISSIIQASELSNIKQKDIAAKEELSLSAVKSRLRRGRSLLKKKLLACCEITFTENGADTICKDKCGC